MAGLIAALFAAPESKMRSAELDALMRSGGQSGSGTRVSWDTALQVSTMLCCTRVIAEGCAQVPWKVFNGANGPIAAPDHEIYDLIHRRPNSWQTSFEFRETILFHLVLTGNSCVRKMRVGIDRRLKALEPIEPGDIKVERERNGRLRYFLRDEHGGWVEIDADEIWHLRGPSWNSWVGLDITRLAREALGLSIATEASHADLHRSGARVSGMYSVEGSLKKEQYEPLQTWLDSFAQGGKRAGKAMILDRAAKFVSTAMKGTDAQHIETRKHQVEEVCRMVRVMPIMVGQADKTATYASAEQMFIAHVVHSLMPWYERITQSADVNLLTEKDRRAGYYTALNPKGLMRGASKDQGEFYGRALGSGGSPAWMTQDEIRALEDLPPKGGEADQLQQGSGAAAQSTEDNPA